MNTRRKLLVALGASSLIAPFGSYAQKMGRSYRIGSAYIAASAATKPLEDSFLAGLRELGFEVGRNLVYDVRNCDGDPARLPAAIDELLALKPDLLFGVEQVARIMKSKTATIPIVLTVSSDPVAAGLVKSLRQPGGNVTGNASLDGSMDVKHVELFREILPRMASIAMLIDTGIPAARSIEGEVRAAAKAKRAKLVTFPVFNRAEIERAFAEMERHRPDALLLGMTSGLFFTNRQFMYENALRLRIPTSTITAVDGRTGALFSYGVNLLQEFRRAAATAARILDGATPGDLPVEQPTRFELVIFLRTAKVLGITIPESVLVRANEVIE